MKFHCSLCDKDFSEPENNKKIESSLIRSIILSCPFCGNKNIELSQHGKLLVDRELKIKKIESNEF